MQFLCCAIAGCEAQSPLLLGDVRLSEAVRGCGGGVYSNSKDPLPAAPASDLPRGALEVASLRDAQSRR